MAHWRTTLGRPVQIDLIVFIMCFFVICILLMCSLSLVDTYARGDGDLAIF